MEQTTDVSLRAPTGISRGLTLLLAAAAGLLAANMYFAQPLLELIAAQLRANAATTGLVVTIGQVGFAAGVVFVVPLGDLVVRRRLIVVLVGLGTLALAGAAVSPSLTVLVSMSAVIGVASVAAQVFIPLAATMAEDAQRGRVIGMIVSGLLIGILAARTVAGLVAGIIGWRALYLAAAGTMLILAATLNRVLPQTVPPARLGYRSLLRSLLSLFGTHPQLRIRSLYGACGFAAFSIFWTASTVLLTGPPYHFGTVAIGLFGVLGVGGALVASRVGRLADRGLERPLTVGCVLALPAGFVLLWGGASSLVPLMAGTLVLDVGVQGLHVLNQNVIYRLDPAARSRLNSVYMTCYFLGGGVGSAAATFSWRLGGWTAVCLVGALFGAIALLARGIADRG